MNQHPAGAADDNAQDRPDRAVVEPETASGQSVQPGQFQFGPTRPGQFPSGPPQPGSLQSGPLQPGAGQTGPFPPAPALPGPRRRLGLLITAIIGWLLVVALAVTTIVLGIRAADASEARAEIERFERTETLRQEALDTGTRYVELQNGLASADFDEDSAELLEMSTPDWAEQIGNVLDIMRSGLDQLDQQRGSSRIAFGESALGPVDDQAAAVVVFFEQWDIRESALTNHTVQVFLVREDGRWLVDDAQLMS